MSKIKKEILDEYNKSLEEENLLNYFGDWINKIDKYNSEYVSNDPFCHIKIDNFLNNDYVEKIYQEFPNNFDNWWKYNNPIEVKYANDDIENFGDNIKKIFYLLSSDKIVNLFSKITDISNLEYDPYLHGAGLHAHPKYGRLNMHLDYEKHPILTDKERRLNIILFLNKDWDEKWAGDNQLWDKNMEKCIVKTYPKFNKAIIFQTNDISWHGLPDKIMCPENYHRKSLAYYYISPLVSKLNYHKFGNDGSGYRTKATFIKRPEDKKLDKMEELYKIRPFRRINKEDMDLIWPDWNPINY